MGGQTLSKGDMALFMLNNVSVIRVRLQFIMIINVFIYCFLLVFILSYTLLCLLCSLLLLLLFWCIVIPIPVLFSD